MKKSIFTILLAIAATFHASAQIIQSTSSKITIRETPKDKPKSYFMIQAGGGLTNLNGETVGGTYNVAFSYNSHFGKRALYWGAQVGSTYVSFEENSSWSMTSGNVIHSYDSENNPSIYFGGKIGLSNPLTEKIDYDLHISINYQYVFNYNCSFFLPTIGAGLWFNKFMVGIDYFHGIGQDADSSSLLLNLGYRF